LAFLREWFIQVPQTTIASGSNNSKYKDIKLAQRNILKLKQYKGVFSMYYFFPISIIFIL